VITAIEDQQGIALGNRPRPAQYIAVGVGGRGRDLPVGQAKARGEQLATHQGIFAGQHGGQAVASLLGKGLGDRLRRVAEHAAGVAQAEVDVLVAVDIMETRPLGALDEQRTGRRPIGHPVHRHAAEQRLASALGQRLRARVALQEARLLGSEELRHGLAADATGSHA